MDRCKTGQESLDGFRKYRRSSRDRDIILPHGAKVRLHCLFRDVEKEFEALYLENIQLRERVTCLERRGPNDGDVAMAAAGPSSLISNMDSKENKEDHDAIEKSVLKSFTKSKAIKTRHKLKEHTSKIVSSFKTPSLLCSLVKEYKGHRDGVWDIAISRVGHSHVGTASADRTARIWDMESGKCLTVYSGHTGSVNAIAFHPSQDLMLTASGDGTAHVWQASTTQDVQQRESAVSSDDSTDCSDEDGSHLAGPGLVGHRGSLCHHHSIRQPKVALSGHQSVVISCSWFNESLAVTAGWDRVANMYNVETGSLLKTLSGHDNELTHVACHPTLRLVATCSADTTFRLWDFRENIHSVSVFQGHTDSVTCACFSKSELIISGSDDRSVKVWDLRNMRAPLTSIQTASAVNKLAVSTSGLIAIPQDNRHVVIHDLSGHKLSRLPRDTAKSHHRMVTAVCWNPEALPSFSSVNASSSGGAGANVPSASAAGSLAVSVPTPLIPPLSSSSVAANEWRSTRANLFSAGFDRLAFGWCVRPASSKDEGAKLKEKIFKEAAL